MTQLLTFNLPIAMTQRDLDPQPEPEEEPVIEWGSNDRDEWGAE